MGGHLRSEKDPAAQNNGFITFTWRIGIGIGIGIGDILSKGEPLALLVGQCRCFLVFAQDRISFPDSHLLRSALRLPVSDPLFVDFCPPLPSAICRDTSCRKRI